MLDKIEMLMKKNGILNKMELSRISDIPYTTIDGVFKRGSDNMKRSTLMKLATTLGCSVDFLADDGLLQDLVRIDPDGLEMIPIYGNISCGNGTLVYEGIEGYESTPKEWLNGGEHFYLRAKGDSMMGARIQDGDLLLIRKQEEVENGEIAAVIINDEAVLKKVYRNGDQLVLQSENPAYGPIFCPPAEARIAGKLKMVTIKF